MTDHAKPPKPRLKKGESPQDPSFQKRMREFNRQIALLEATQAQAEQNEREAAARAKRDILKEAKTAAPKKAEPKTAVDAVDQGVAEADKDSAPRKGVRGAAAALASSTKRIDAAVEEAETGVRKKRKKK